MPGLYDILSLAVRERARLSPAAASARYTLTCSEGTLSVYAAFSHRKHLVVQIAQSVFLSYYRIFNMPEKCKRNPKKNNKFYASKTRNPYSSSI